jgi:2-hydroxy-3-keto-5-methylthiopentenyl-1-phosphate phosphatase
MKIYDKIVFCDFDGTITAEETLVAMLYRFVPEKMKEFGKLFAEKKISLRVGVRNVVESIPSEQYPRAVDFIRDKAVRPGFSEFLEFLANKEIPFVVISGGLMDSVNTRLKPYAHLIHEIHAAGIDDSGQYLKVVSEFEAGDELVAKVPVMSLYRFKECAAIGDGATDQKMAMEASMVFARGGLARFLEENGHAYVPWNDFFNIRDYLEKIWT